MITSRQNTKNGLIILENLDKVAKAIGRDQKFIISYLKRKLNTSIELKNNKYVIRLSDHIDMDNLIEDLIEENVLCKTCNNPETILEDAKIKCKACGYLFNINI